MTEDVENAVVAAALDAGINFFDTAEGTKCFRESEIQSSLLFFVMCR